MKSEKRKVERWNGYEEERGRKGEGATA